MGAARVIDDFELSANLEAAEPPEARGLRRDDVRLLVSDIERDAIEHAHFHDLPRWLSAGDLLVVNVSGTLNAALTATDDEGRAFELHLSTRLPGGFWTVEVRRPGATASLPYSEARAGATFRLPADGQLTLLAPYPLVASLASPSRLWIGALQLPCSLVDYLEQYGFPIRYGYVPQAWPSAMYQTVFATEPGSAEMPSAGRPFSPELVTRLVSRGVEIAPILLHTGVASQEKHEPPYEEFYRVPRHTADRVTTARRAGGRVVAVGTTVVRALETVTDGSGLTVPGEGWTSLVVTPDRPLRSVSGLITGLHEPRATHLALLEAVAAVPSTEDGAARAPSSGRGRRHLQRAYDEARRLGYLWHEFGDSHLILARGRREEKSASRDSLLR
jgi:S-adenosylmethionine:tRNA ribosyltransferase-isomerase